MFLHSCLHDPSLKMCTLVYMNHVWKSMLCKQCIFRQACMVKLYLGVQFSKMFSIII